MGKTHSKRQNIDKDIKIKLSNAKVYNVSNFLRKYDSNEYSDKLMDNFNTFIQLLDAKVYIDTNDPRYLHIYQGIDIIVKRVAAELAKLDPYFAFAKLQRTGSSTSGVKVGLPHESDYVLKLTQEKQLKSGKSLFEDGVLFSFVRNIVAKQHVTLTDGLPLWKIHGTKDYRKTGGVCLIMECRARANDPASEKVGITVDLVPVYITESTHESLNKKAEAFLPLNLDQYANRGGLYQLVSEWYCDTGFIENVIMKELPEATKQSYRVAKYIFSHSYVGSQIPYEDIRILDERKRLDLYGRKSSLSSYVLRVLFLHLLLNVRGTEAEDRLKGGLLVLCLLDMVEQYAIKNLGVTLVCQILTHPLVEHRDEKHLSVHYYRNTIDEILYRLEKVDPAQLVDDLDLLNHNAVPVSV